MNLRKDFGHRVKSTGKLFLTLTILYATSLLALGTWWLYLIVKYGEKISELTGESGSNIAKMVKWEGATFFTLLVLLSASLLFLYWKDQKKTKGLQAFYASMTHELKTPLASIKLQSEVLKEKLEPTEGRIQTLMGRLVEDTNKLETQMDKILQLSRIEGGGNLNLSGLNFKEMWNNCLKRYAENLSVTGEVPKDIFIQGDELALSLILRNLFENTFTHSGSKSATIQFEETPENTVFIYKMHSLLAFVCYCC